MTADPPPALQQAQIAEYAEVCRSHTAVSDFRAKLLALLPVVSGVATGVLVVRGSEKVTSIEPGVLIAVGLFGFLATFGLFLYELWLVDECHQLRRRAAQLEWELRLGESAQFGAAFRFGQPSLREVYASASRERRNKAMRTVGEPQDPRDVEAAAGPKSSRSALHRPAGGRTRRLRRSDARLAWDGRLRRLPAAG